RLLAASWSDQRLLLDDVVNGERRPPHLGDRDGSPSRDRARQPLDRPVLSGIHIHRRAELGLKSDRAPAVAKRDIELDAERKSPTVGGPEEKGVFPEGGDRGDRR